MFLCIKGGGATLDVGIYPIAMASLVFGGGRPESIKASGYLTDAGVDELVSVTVKYPGSYRTTDKECGCNAREHYVPYSGKILHRIYIIWWFSVFQ